MSALFDNCSKHNKHSYQTSACTVIFMNKEIIKFLII